VGWELRLQRHPSWVTQQPNRNLEKKDACNVPKIEMVPPLHKLNYDDLTTAVPHRLRVAEPGAAGGSALVEGGADKVVEAEPSGALAARRQISGPVNALSHPSQEQSVGAREHTSARLDHVCDVRRRITAGRGARTRCRSLQPKHTLLKY
jgi:hypothetical protein